MSNYIINVQPVNIVKTIEKIELTEIIVTPFTGAFIKVMLRDINNVYIDNRNLEMNTEDYLKWQNDDNYIINWTLEKLNLIQK